ncbi:glycoprotein [Gata virus]|uniref:Glycoprotein n=1 Tax=Gata virus TaxID=1911435 RepID=A0A2Z2CF63_9RHAB|nr:glycoprotein [Gata virus]AOX47528.1 glycoprotein [Gata virus]
MSVLMIIVMYLPTVSSVLIPIPLEKPHPINSHELVCHYGLPPSPTSFSTTYKLSFFTPSQTSHKVDGFLCSKTIWETKCDEGFFGSQTISYIIRKSQVRDGECLEAFQSFTDGGDIPTPHFPPNYCSWMATNSKSSTYITLTRHDTYWDPYQNAFKDLVFIGHSCSQVICPTHYDNVKWITGPPSRKSCTTWFEVEGEITLDSGRNLDWSYVEAEFIPRTPLSNLCYGVSYCGRTGYVLNNGLFFSISAGLNDTLNFARDIPIKSCSPSTEISLHPLSSSMASVELQTLEILFNTKCNDVVSKIKSGNNITAYELGFLNPTHPGIGYSFISIEGRLYSSKTQFEPIKEYKLTFSNAPSIKYLSKDKTYKIVKVDNCTWISLNNGSMTCRWYNGVYITQDQIIFPYSSREESQDELDIYAEIRPNFDRHIGIPDISNDTITTSDQVTDPDYINPDVLGTLNNWLIRWFHYVGLGVSLMFIGAIIYCCRSCLFKCCKFCCCVTTNVQKAVPKVIYRKRPECVKISNLKGSDKSVDFQF